MNSGRGSKLKNGMVCANNSLIVLFVKILFLSKIDSSNANNRKLQILSCNFVFFTCSESRLLGEWSYFWFLDFRNICKNQESFNDLPDRSHRNHVNV